MQLVFFILSWPLKINLKSNAKIKYSPLFRVFGYAGNACHNDDV